MPDNYHEPSHASMRATALMEGMPWSGEFAGARIGDLADEARPDIDPIESTETFYDALVPQAESVDVWKTTYMHVLAGPAAIVDWVRSTGLQPYVNMIRDEEAKKAFLKEYEKKIAECYSSMADGKVLLKYPRFFVVAVRK
jgi:trans-aconitate 2-methyltransferase